VEVGGSSPLTSTKELRERETSAKRRHETATPETARARGRARGEGEGKREESGGTEHAVRAGSYRAGTQAPTFAHVAA